MPPTKHQTEDDHADNDDDKPITQNGLVKWGGLALAGLSVILGLSWKIADLRQEVVVNRTERVMKDMEHDKAISELKGQTESNTRVIGEIKSKLDTLVEILQRVEKKVDQAR